MTAETTELNLKGCNFAYDYANKCDCSEDDKCGCSYPNNLPHDFNVKCTDRQSLNGDGGQSCDININKEKVEIQTPNVHIKKDSVCTCSPQGCECTVVRDEYTK